jgi:hypothetical protein
MNEKFIFSQESHFKRFPREYRGLHLLYLAIMGSFKIEPKLNSRTKEILHHGVYVDK